ncbi:MAG: hypothetical protein ACOYB3_01100 [Azonexus sp.]
MGTKTSKLIVDALLGDQDIDGFMDTFQKPYTPMLKLFGPPHEDWADDQWDKTFTDPKRRSRVRLRVLVTHLKPVKHGVHGEYTQEEKTVVQFGISDPTSDVETGHTSRAREGMEGYGVFVRLPQFITRLKHNWPMTKDVMHNQVKLFLREIAPPGYFDDVTP